jgi:DNA-binding response OmpR family regulator
MTRVLVADDEPAIRWLISRVLTSNGYEVIEAADGQAAVDALDQHPDLIVLDLIMPDLDGMQVLKEVRRRGDTPVILLTALSTEADRIGGLDHGADDYLIKPFSLGEFEARVRALLRRSGAGAGHEGADPLHIDRAAREVRLRGTRVLLTRREFDLLVFLSDNPRRVVGIAELLEQVWHSSIEWQDPNTVKEHVRRLRLKLEPDPAHPVLLRTVRGSGYLYEPGALRPPVLGTAGSSAR